MPRPIAIVTYTFHHLEAPEMVRDFLDSDAMLDYCASNLMPMVMTPINAESLSDYFDGLVEAAESRGQAPEIGDAQRQAVIDWFAYLASSESTFIAAVEG